MTKTAITVTVENDLIEKAREKHINISAAAENGILKKLNLDELQSKSEYPLELANSDPENYFIQPASGKCLKRIEPQFFMNENNGVVPLTKEEYLLKLGIAGRNTYSKTKKIPKEGQISLHN